MKGTVLRGDFAIYWLKACLNKLKITGWNKKDGETFLVKVYKNANKGVWYLFSDGKKIGYLDNSMSDYEFKHIVSIINDINDSPVCLIVFPKDSNEEVLFTSSNEEMMDYLLKIGF